jgi:glycosyltransferase involved in cell wall biosynthesis
MPTTNDLWIVVPAYNEATVIYPVITELITVVSHNVIVVDDGSTDNTAPEAHCAGAKVIHHDRNYGQGRALVTGIQYALSSGAEYIATFDADGQHEAFSLRFMLSDIRTKGVDIVLGSRLPPTHSLRRLMLRVATWFTRVHSGLNVSDTHNGLRLMNRKAAEAIRITQPRMAHASEILREIRRNNLKWSECPVSIRYTEYSRSKGQPLMRGSARILWDLAFRK